MIIVLICLLFFSSVAFGQMLRPLGSNVDISGKVFFNDGITPFVAPAGCTAQVLLFNYDTGSFNGQMSGLDSSGRYDISDVDPRFGPYHLLVRCINNTDQQMVYNQSIIPTYSEEFNVTAGTDMVMNVTTSRMLTN